LASISLPSQSELDAFLLRALSLLRWATLLALLLIVLVRPSVGFAGVPMWALVLAFSAYNLLIEVLRFRLSARGFLRWMSILDLPVAGVCYFLGGAAGGMLFVLFFLAIDSAAAGMTMRGTLGYTATVAASVTVIELLIGFQGPTIQGYQMLGARLVMLALVGTLVAILTRRLDMEHATARSVRDEAERLETLERLRGEFLATTSHDLRTPLTAARTVLRLIEVSAADRLRPDERDLLENGRRNVERLDLLIGDLLAFNQLESGSLELDLKPVDLRVIASGSLALVSLLTDEKGQLLTSDLPDLLPVRGDARRLEQVLVNLLDNAHRHTPRGTAITVSGRATANEVRITVRDTGPGIPPAAWDALFQRLSRPTPPHPTSASAEGTARGSGRGLAIARAIVELHGGRIWMERGEMAPGKATGAVFHIALPRDHDAEMG